MPTNWCDYSNGRGCAMDPTRPSELQYPLEAMAAAGARAGINELIFDQETFARLLPHSVDAIFWDPQRSSGVQERELHRRFCERFGLRLEQVPFVRLGEGGQQPLFVGG